ncbi:bifunctional diaminohydroxyphosphoribosylaminopyrimidine deaminase/5-amino-6-(5-phosphoribosylamino)uracil reductase RibD [Sulfurospirillum arcachonense]|uniref:bifunctional diaminohydroxyphosphoribosylaminopyrimidine deaminase/5-amino-6-(5-phosphoribosylamino)uracil reductase RibD n=1 Tax=Sulfurospirillum arcachonense TaxID=57666 RepID=UPI00046AE3D1|nr:bifunctional diaminohydroxyphosphoribosylaminopyrimidine deaminase/5-amino-6-(5-phosphoribosylamino)uracil reductase RibD [Sulfurospirillum arcachonense]
MVNIDEYFMQLALDKAWAYQGLTFPNPAVGTAIADKNSNLIATGVHQFAGLPHAEVNAIKNAYLKISHDTNIENIVNSHEIHDYLLKNHNGIFSDKTIYVTLEPCNHIGKTPACSQLIKELKFKRVVIGSLDINKQASGGVKTLESAGINVDIGILKEKCDELLESFSIWQKDTFVFFKIAMSKNNVIDGGIITGKASRTHVHALRDKCDLLVIGGNTVRVDRPTLDARMVNGKAPDVLIYSKEKNIDKNIPLFNIKNREVFIEDNLDKIKEYKFVMIEGGFGMYEAIKDMVDYILVYRSSYEKNGNKITLEQNLKEFFSMPIENDTLTWYKKTWRI